MQKVVTIGNYLGERLCSFELAVTFLRESSIEVYNSTLVLSHGIDKKILDTGRFFEGFFRFLCESLNLIQLFFVMSISLWF